MRDKDFIATADKAIISPNYESFKIVGHTVTKMYDLDEDKNKSKNKNKGIME